MGRPPLPAGSHGNIRTKKIGTTWVAATYVRDGDGRRREIRREAKSKSAAGLKLQAALENRAGFSTSAIDRNAKLELVATAWLEHCARQVEAGDMAPNTARLYTSIWNSHVKEAVGQLRVHEATVPRLDAFIVSMRTHQGPALTKTARTVLNGILGYAVRHGAMTANPMREVSRISGGTKREPRAMTAKERREWLFAIDRDEKAIDEDVPDLTRWMLSTGVRMGECLAIRFEDVNLLEREVTISHGITRVKGRGLLRGPVKTRSSVRTIGLTDSLVTMVEERLVLYGEGPLFPNTKGGHRDPSNTSRCIREARERAGIDWVTSHVFRKTVATVMDQANVTTRVVSDQLGHSRISMTQDVYMARRAPASEALRALEDAERGSND
ncbi:site-specific recombinase XerD [Pseudonocardia sediminis]|uniref:Site-specific recombinase XerD n=1 Tax=Pseudonocardia sediminis TaxID=1397368 RepID=A0A4Q7V4B9_PSEST|nr:site-specific integrase [Pseudonocardia sediminis]RZT87573.1 site-specific recombinase XerD [Pseudonocardia sediminis]